MIVTREKNKKEKNHVKKSLLSYILLRGIDSIQSAGGFEILVGLFGKGGSCVVTVKRCIVG
jgi:hypothetical protein